MKEKQKLAIVLCHAEFHGEHHTKHKPKGEMMEQAKDFNEMAKERYAEIQKQEVELKAKLDEIQKQKGPLKAYLLGAGLIEVRRRGPRKKKNI